MLLIFVAGHGSHTVTKEQSQRLYRGSNQKKLNISSGVWSGVTRNEQSVSEASYSYTLG